jgi:hypothetical protein
MSWFYRGAEVLMASLQAMHVPELVSFSQHVIGSCVVTRRVLGSLGRGQGLMLVC